jgi:hypothetical protein
MDPLVDGGLFRIESPHFTCGLTVKRGLVMTSAPITGYMVGWTLTKVRRYCTAKEWKFTCLGAFSA